VQPGELLDPRNLTEVREVEVGGGKAIAVRVALPDANLLVVRARRGFVMCGYLDVSAAERFGDVAAVVRGVSSIEDVLGAKIAECTTKARELGVTPGMPAAEALALMQ